MDNSSAPTPATSSGPIADEADGTGKLNITQPLASNSNAETDSSSGLAQDAADHIQTQHTSENREEPKDVITNSQNLATEPPKVLPTIRKEAVENSSATDETDKQVIDLKAEPIENLAKSGEDGTRNPASSESGHSTPQIDIPVEDLAKDEGSSPPDLSGPSRKATDTEKGIATEQNSSIKPDRKLKSEGAPHVDATKRPKAKKPQWWAPLNEILATGVEASGEQSPSRRGSSSSKSSTQKSSPRFFKRENTPGLSSKPHSPSPLGNYGAPAPATPATPAAPAAPTIPSTPAATKSSLPTNSTPPLAICQKFYDVNSKSIGRSHNETVDIVVVYLYNSKVPGSELSPFVRDTSADVPKDQLTAGKLAKDGPLKTNSLTVPQSSSETRTAKGPTTGKDKESTGSRNAKNSQQEQETPGRPAGLARLPSAEIASATKVTSQTWLSDGMLSSKFPRSRILGYGFDLEPVNTKINFEAATEDLLESIKLSRSQGTESSTPIVFIAHGYASIIVQRLLFRNDKVLGKEMKALVAAVVLFEPPLSTDANSLMSWTTKRLSVKDTIFAGFDNQSDALKKIWKDFDECVKDPNTYVFVYLPRSTIGDQTANINDQDTRQALIDSIDKKYDFVDEPYGRPGQVATFYGSADQRFENFTKQLTKTVQTRQILGAAERSEFNTLEKLIKDSIDVNLHNKDGQTALHVGAQGDSADFMSTLLDSGQVKLNAKDVKGRTALHLVVLTRAEKTNTKKIAETLLKVGADPYVEDQEGVTPDKLVEGLGDDDKSGLKLLFQKKPWVEGPRVKKKPRVLDIPKEGNEDRLACEGTEAVATEIFNISSEDESPERHLTTYPSVWELVYSDKTMDEIFDVVRPGDIHELPFCRWYHIPANNMIWIEALFAKLKVSADPWPSRLRDDGVPHTRSMNPQAAEMKSLGANQQENTLAILIPYISYEEIVRQQDIAELIRATHQGSSTMEKLGLLSILIGKLMQGLNRDMYEKEVGSHKIRETATNLVKSFARKRLTGDKYSHYGEAERPEPQDDLIKQVTKLSADIQKEQAMRATDIGHQIIAYLNYDPPLHPRRTLDQSYYYMLPNTAERDTDQVVSRRAVKEARRSHKDSNIAKIHSDTDTVAEKESESQSQTATVKLPESHNILMVDQLWLWLIKSTEPGKPDIVITSFPTREGVKGRDSAAVDDLQASVLKNPTIHSRGPILSTQDLVSRLMTISCRTLDRHQHLKSVEFLQLFQSTVGDAEYEETRLFEEFRTITNRLYSLHEEHPGYQEARSDNLKILLNIRRECDLLKEIKDVLDEIKMIKAILTDQLDVLNAKCYSKFFPDLYSTTTRRAKEDGKTKGDGKKIEETIPTPGAFTEAKQILEDIIRNFDTMEMHANSVERGLNHLLDLKQMQANLWEARSSREGAEETAKQGNTLIVFTVVTIIFLPLSFMASFFALGIDAFPQDAEGNTSWPLSYVSGLLFGISFLLSIILLIVAFNIDWFKDPWDKYVKIGLKKESLHLVSYLRHIPLIRARIIGFNWTVKLSNALYKTSSEKSSAVQDKKQRCDLWVEGLAWKIPDGVVEFPDAAAKLDGRQYWSLAKFLPLFIDDQQIVVGEEGEQLAEWAEPLSEEFLKIEKALEREVRRRGERGIKVDAKLAAFLGMDDLDL